MSSPGRSRRIRHLRRLAPVLAATAAFALASPAIAGTVPTPAPSPTGPGPQASSGTPTTAASPAGPTPAAPPITVQPPTSSPSTPPAVPQPTVIPPSTRPQTPLSPTDPRLAATATARKTKKGVAVDALTDEYEQTVANPDGTYTWTSSVEPVRTRTADGKSWTPVDTSLAKRADGSIGPKAVVGSVTFSGGGTAPLVTLVQGTAKLALSWPTALPKPSIAGDTATYANVLPQVDLKIQATARGGFSDVIVVHDATAAANPALKTLHLAAATSGVTLSADPAGNIVAADAHGTTVFAAGAPLMWDSSAKLAATVKTSGRSTPLNVLSKAAQTPIPTSPSSPAGSSTPVGVKVTPSEIDLTPDTAMMAGKATTFPLYIDPSVAPTGGLNHWDGVQQCAPSVNNYDTRPNGTDPGDGYQGYASTCGTGVERVYYDVAMPGGVGQGAYILPGTGQLHTVVTYAAANGQHTDTVSLAVTSALAPPTVKGGQTGGTTWNAQPCRWDITNWACSTGTSATTSFTTYANSPTGQNGTYVYPVFDMTNAMQAAANRGMGDITVGLFNSTETDSNSFVRFGTTVYTYFTATYDYNPTVGTIATTPLAHNQGNQNLCTSGYMGANDSGTVLFSVPVYSSSQNQGAKLGANFWMNDNTSNAWYWNKIHAGGTLATGQSVTFTTANNLSDGHNYTYWADAYDGTLEGPAGPQCSFTVDRTAPTQPAVTASPQFPTVTSGTPAPGLRAHSLGDFKIHATDPGTNPSGVWCFEYVFDGTLGATSGSCNYTNPNGNGGTVLADANGNGDIYWAPPMWGTHDLKVVAVDKAGNTSPQSLDYLMYAMDDPNAVPSPGNITGDGVPNLLSVDASGNLVAYQAAIGSSATGTAPLGSQIAATAANSPDGSSWANFQVTHRGSMSGKYVDDLLVHKPGSPTLYVYINDGAGHFSAGHMKLITMDANFAGAVQIVALGDADAGALGADSTAGSRNPVDFLAVTPDTNGVNQLFLYTYLNVSRFSLHGQISNFAIGNNPLSAVNTATPALFSPGDNTGDGLPDLWYTDTSGVLHQIASAKNSDGTVDWNDGIGGRNPSGFSQIATGLAGYKTVTSSGAVITKGHPDLWTIDASGNVALAPQANLANSITQATTGSNTGPVLSWMLGNGNKQLTGGSATSDVALSPTTANQITKESDSSGLGNDGTATGGTVTEVNAHDGGAANFDGASQVSTTGQVVNTSRAFTASVWVNPATLDSGNHEAVSADSNLSSSFMIGYTGSTSAWWAYLPNVDSAGPGGPVIIAANGSAKAGAWTHLVLTYDSSVAGGTATLFVNGQQAGSVTGFAAFQAINGLVTGRAQYGGNHLDYWTGGIDDVTVYNRAIASAEVTALYDAGRPNVLVPTLLASNDGTKSTSCVTDAAHPAISTTTNPTLSASVSEPDATVATHADFELRDVTDPTAPASITFGGTGSASGNGPNVSVTTAGLTDGHEYAFAARGDDGNGNVSFSSPSCYFRAEPGQAVANNSLSASAAMDDTYYPARSGEVDWVGASTTLKWQTDGNLVAYNNATGAAMWASNTAGNTSAVLVLQNDGNLVIYAYQPTINANGWVSGLPIWASGTSGTGANRLIVESGGEVALADNSSNHWTPGAPGQTWATSNTATRLYPTAALTIPAAAYAGETITVDAGPTLPGSAAISSYRFDTGDGNTVSTASATTSHSYSAAGFYVVDVDVTDANGKTTTAQTVIQVVPSGLVANPGFETGSLVGWPAAYNSGITTTNTHGGTYAGQINAPAGGNGAIEQVVNGLTPNTLYTLTGWIRTDGGNTLLGTKFYDADPNDDTGASTTATAWTQLSSQFMTGPTNTSVDIYCYRSTAGTSACDDFNLTPTPATVVNPDFESGSLAGWPAAYNSGITTTNPHGGTYAGQINAPTGGNGAIEQVVTGLTPNTTYTLTGWIRTDGGNTLLGTKFYDADPNDDTGASTTATAWTQLSSQFTTGPNNTTVDIYCYRSTAGTSACDDFALTKN